MSKEIFYEMREQEVAHLLTEVEEGNIAALSTYGNLKKCQALYSEAIKQIEEIAFNEADLYSEKTFKDSGFVFEKRNGGIRYSFKHIEEWQEIENQKKELEARSKQAYLAIQRNLLVGSEDGEVVEIPKVSYTKNSLIVK
tara:strand:+ start:543 stop:962 length:420 start_codon:yes stop_codon:yes gene_type:complete